MIKEGRISNPVLITIRHCGFNHYFLFFFEISSVYETLLINDVYQDEDVQLNEAYKFIVRTLKPRQYKSYYRSDYNQIRFLATPDVANNKRLIQKLSKELVKISEQKGTFLQSIKEI